MKVLIWVLSFLVITTLNILFGYATGVRMGKVLLYLVWLFVARALCKKWDSKQSSDFYKRITERANTRDILFDKQQPKAEDYGYSMENPVMTSSISYSDKYLLSLRTIDGQKFTWKRIGSYCVSNLHGVNDVMVDEYQLFLNGESYKKIYLCPYGHSGSFVPQDLKLDNDDFGIEKEAIEKGVPTNEILYLREMEQNNARLKQQIKEEEKKKIEEITNHIKTYYPSFDYNLESKNPLFIKLAAANVDMKSAYEILHKNQLLVRKKSFSEQYEGDFYTSEQYYHILCSHDSFLTKIEENKNQSEEEMAKIAADKGITVEGWKSFLEMEEKNAEERKKVYWSQSKNAERVKNEYPDFNLTEELKNSEFKSLISKDIDMQIAYELIHLNEVFDRK